MNGWRSGLEWLEIERVQSVLQALVVLGIGLVLARLAASGVRRLVQGRGTAQQAMIARRVTFYGILAIAGVSALNQLGFDLSVLLGAAGILTVAVGFASQTSASNLISGLFLLGERPFVVGDLIKVGEIVGEVVTIDLLSVKLRTFDNLSVRIPNETLLKSEITNFTKYPIRRIDIKIGVAYKEDLRKVQRVLQEVAESHPLCLDEPKPLFIFVGFGDSAIDLLFCVWAKRESFLDVMNGVKAGIKEAFDREGIEIPFPHRSLYAGSASAPLPVRLVAGAEGAAAPE